jgi:hypothetical protein
MISKRQARASTDTKRDREADQGRSAREGTSDSGTERVAAALECSKRERLIESALSKLHHDLCPFDLLV